MTEKIQYRINNEGDVLITDLESNQRVNIQHRKFNEIKTEVRDRMDNKKFSSIKMTTQPIKDLHKMESVFQDLIQNKLVPEMLHIVNDSLAEHKMNLTLDMVINIIAIMMAGVIENVCKIYPSNMRSMIMELMGIQASEKIVRAIEMIKDKQEVEIIDKELYIKLQNTKDPEEQRKIIFDNIEQRIKNIMDKRNG